MTSDWNDLAAYFDLPAVAHVATILPDGGPHVVPVWVGVDGDRIAIFTRTDSRKDRNLQRDPRVAVSMTRPENPLDMAFLRGAVTERIVGDEALPIIDRIATKYTGGPYELRSGMTVFLIEPKTWLVQDYSD